MALTNETLSGIRLNKVLEALEDSWQAEMEGYRTYNALADRDTDPVRAQVLRHLAAAELEHAELWHGRIVELGGAWSTRACCVSSPASFPTSSRCSIAASSKPT